MLIRPRLTDYHGIHAAQVDLDFAIPFLDEDIPLYLDPFMLWRSPSQQDQSLHTSLINAFNHLGLLASQGREAEAIETLVIASECDEVGLGTSLTRKGKRIGAEKAKEIVALFKTIPHYQQHGFRHFEEIQFFVEGISKDRISDISCNFLKSFLIDFTIDQCERHNIPTQSCTVEHVYDYRANKFVRESGVTLPVNPENNEPIILVPKRWMRFAPWINYDEYFEKHCPQDEVSHNPEELTRVKVLSYNRHNYGAVEQYIQAKERSFEDCENDPLFSQIPVTSAKRVFAQIKKLPTGKTGGADIKYENLVGRLLPSLLYPKLDFAQEQARTDDGVSIRDLIFYNTRSTPLLQELMDDYGSRQITFEMKNVAAVERTHIDQINRYLTDDLGKFGVLVTRNPLKKAEMTRTVNLWAGQRKSVIALTDADLEQMVEVFESKQRDPIDIVNKKYVEFRRACP
ncbi:hypothetical protein [Ruegeria arenilitoris]|uniref:hypothetical protein n=1 Tax=Ruegeria arenilitoris TaxID=1173585 RepID=UPI0020C314CE|nr:hypothetical protein [Ruegeria arenilitoris]